MIHANHDGHYLNALRWNSCIAAARDDTDVFIQVDDVRLRTDFIHQHVKWHVNSAEYVVTGAKFEGEDETWELASCRRARLAGPHGAPNRVNYLAAWGASLSYTYSMVRKVWHAPYDRPFDERMRGWGFQEVELIYRMEMQGALVVYDPSAGVFHRNHLQSRELGRGLDRDALVSQGYELNERYFRKKHSLDELPWQ